MSSKSKLLTLMLLFSGQVRAEGLDLNPALLGCIMSGGSCLTSTGIKFIDDFFSRDNNVPYHTDESFCRAYLGSWCSGPTGYRSAYNKCREAKKEFFKSAKQKLGEWKPPTGQKPRSCSMLTEDDYFRALEEKFTKPGEPRFFDCRPRQRFIWLKSRCGKTRIYGDFYGPQRSAADSAWDREKTLTCEGDWYDPRD